MALRQRRSGIVRHGNGGGDGSGDGGGSGSSGDGGGDESGGDGSSNGDVGGGLHTRETRAGGFVSAESASGLAKRSVVCMAGVRGQKRT